MICEGRESRQRLRSTYNVQIGHPDRLESFRTSYALINKPNIHAAILRTNKQIYEEASHVLYSSYIFDFAQDVESVIPFLTDRTPFALSSIRKLNLVKRSPTSSRYFDQSEWNAACDFISTHLELQHLGLGVFGGTATTTSYVKDTFVKSDFNFITLFENMEWVRHLLAVRGLKRLDIRTIWEACPMPTSNALGFFVNFSASIEKGFAEYLREKMVTSAA